MPEVFTQRSLYLVACLSTSVLPRFPFTYINSLRDETKHTQQYVKYRKLRELTPVADGGIKTQNKISASGNDRPKETR